MIIRPATADDAPRYVAHVRRIVEERPATAPLALDEVRTVEDMAAWIASPITLIALDDAGDAMLGTINLRRTSPRRALHHTAVLGMSVRAESRGQGVGSALMRAALAWAADNGLTRVELQVFADNARAIALYEKHGFRHEGRRRNAVFLDGAYLDDLIMAWVR